MDLIIYGASGFGKEILDLAININNKSKFFENVIIVDDLNSGKKMYEHNVISINDLRKNVPPNSAKFVIALGEPKYRKKYRELLTNAGFEMQSLIHPSVEIGKNTVIGNGVIIQKGVVLTIDIKISNNVCIQPNATIAHEVLIGEDSFVASNVTLSGNVHMGKCSYIAIGVPVKQGINIGDNVIIGMGSCVSKNVPSNAVTTGNPLKILKDMNGYNIFK